MALRVRALKLLDHRLRQIQPRPCRLWCHTPLRLQSVFSHPNLASHRPISLVPNRKFSNRNEDFVAHHLDDRTLLKINGQDVPIFLQGLITNDIDALNQDEKQNARSLYSLLLNVQGRVLYDMILYAITERKNDTDGHEGQTYLLECSKDVAADLSKLFKRYKIRKKVNMDRVGDEYSVWAVFSKSGTEEAVTPLVSDPSTIISYEPDPRLKLLGHRLILPAAIEAQSVLSNVGDVSDKTMYKQHRFRLGVAEGAGELPVAGCLPLESNAAFLNGVSFNKGCYIGQELTARTHHTGLTRKRIMPLVLEKDIQVDSCALHNSSDKKCGVLRGTSGHYGIGLMRIPDTVGKGPLSLKDEEGNVLTTAQAIIPSWWQTDSDQILKQVMTDYPAEFTSTNK